MTTNRLFLLLLIPALLLLTACETNEDTYHPPGQYPSNFSVNANGSNLQMYDARVIGIGNVFYVDDQTIFYQNSKLMRRDLNGITYFQIVPDSMSCSGLLVDKAAQLLYFIGNGDLYRCGFWGENLTNLTPQNSKTLAEPHRPGTGRYITMVGRVGYVAGIITNYDLETGQLTEYFELPRAWEAFYNPEYNSFIYQDRLEIKKIDADGQNLSTLLATPYQGYDLQQSFDDRYLFIRVGPQAYYSGAFWVYDYDQQNLRSLGNSSAYTLAENRNMVYAVRGDSDWSQLTRINLDTGWSDVIFDGFWEDFRMTGASFLTIRSDEGRIYVKARFVKDKRGLVQ